MGDDFTPLIQLGNKIASPKELNKVRPTHDRPASKTPHAKKEKMIKPTAPAAVVILLICTV